MRNILSRISWKKVNTFLQCKRCFYKEHVLRKKRPGLDPDCFSLNNAVDTLLKTEFDQYRIKQIPHPIMIKNEIDAIPFANELLYIWRDYNGGIRCNDHNNSLELYGVIDEVWINPNNELIVVDFKTTSKHKQLRALEPVNKWSISNNRQIAFYASLLKRWGYKVHDTGYFIYSAVLKDKRLFNQVLEFEMSIQPCRIDDSWVELTMQDVRRCLEQAVMPDPSQDCEFCKYDLN